MKMHASRKVSVALVVLLASSAVAKGKVRPLAISVRDEAPTIRVSSSMLEKFKAFVFKKLERCATPEERAEAQLLYSGLKVEGGSANSTQKRRMAGCSDIPNWKDSYGDSCDFFEAYKECGGTSTWEYTEPISASVDSNGVSAVDACCACGGGNGAACTDYPNWATTPKGYTCSNFAALGETPCEWSCL